MRSIRNYTRPICNFIGKSFLFSLIPLAAYAADAVAKTYDFSSPRWWAVFAFVQLVVLVGYAASSLSQWAGWVTGDATTRLTLVQGLFTALMAGNCAYWLAIAGGLADIPSMIAAGSAGWGGEKFLTPLLTKVTDTLGVFFGKGDKA